MSDNLENAISKKPDKIKVDELGIIVTGSVEEPYYSLKYHIPGNNYHNIGFSSYCLQTVIRFRDEYFILVPKEEAEVDWSKVKVNTPILVSNNPNLDWTKRYFARFEDGEVYAWVNGGTSWTRHNGDVRAWKYAKLAESEE